MSCVTRFSCQQWAFVGKTNSGLKVECLRAAAAAAVVISGIYKNPSTVLKPLIT